MPLSSFIIYPLIIGIALINFITNRNHLIISLLNLELIILRLVLILIPSFSTFSLNNSSLILLILTVGACAAALGLACLVKITQSYGNDNLISLSLIKC